MTEQTKGVTPNPTAVETKPVPKIYAALMAAMKDIEATPVEKNGHFKATTRGGDTIEYDYVKAEDVEIAASRAMIAAGIVQEATATHSYVKRETTTQAGFAPVTNVNLTLKLIAIEDGSSITVKASGEGSGTDDKSIRKALTSASKMANMLAFKIATAELDPDDQATTSAPQKDEKPAGPNRGQQRIADAKDTSTPTPSDRPKAANKVVELQGAIREAAKKRVEAGEPDFDYLKFGAKVTGTGTWARDAEQLQVVLDKIKAGETA